MTGSRIAVIATAGDRRDEDVRELGRVAAGHFDTIVIREDANPRGRRPGETAGLIEEGVRAAMSDGARCKTVEIRLEEIDAARHALDLAEDGDIVVVCVDHANEVWQELQRRQHGGPSGADGAGDEGEPRAITELAELEEPFAAEVF